jgi:hypothetical protein
MPEKIIYRLVLVAQQGEIAPIIRLRQLLKVCLRRFGFRCIGIEEVSEVGKK